MIGGVQRAALTRGGNQCECATWRNPGKPEHVPTDEQRDQVKAMIAIGGHQDAIAAYMKIAPKTLRKHYRHEIDHGRSFVHLALGAGAVSRALAGNDTMTAFVLKTQFGWREVNRTEISGIDGAPIKVESARERLAGRIAGLAAVGGAGEDPGGSDGA